MPPIAQLKRKEMERERAAYAAARRRKTDGGATAAELRGDLLTDAIADHLQRQAARDADPFLRDSASSIPQIYDDCTSRGLTWALTRSAALGNPYACIRSLGEIFDNLSQKALIPIARFGRGIIPEGGLDVLPVDLDHAWGEVEWQIYWLIGSGGVVGILESDTKS